MNSNHYQLFTILIGFRTASPAYAICPPLIGAASNAITIPAVLTFLFISN